MERTVIKSMADIFYMDEGRETIRQCYNANRSGYLELAKEMAKTHVVTKVFVTDMTYTEPAGRNVSSTAYWYRMEDGEFILTHQYEL